MTAPPNRTRRRYAVPWVALLVIGLTLPILAVSGQRTLETMLNAPPLWVPASLPYRQDYDWFRKHFHCEDLLLLSYEGCQLGDPAVDDILRVLAEPPADTEDSALLRASIADAASGPQLLRTLLGSRLGLSREQAINRLRGSFIGPDSEATCLVVTLTPEGARRRGEVLDALKRTVSQVAGVSADAIRLAGAPVDGAAIDQASLQAINQLALPSAAIATVLCLVLLRSPAFTAAIVLVALYCQALVLASVGFTGGEMNAVLTVMPALVFVLTVSAGIHLANYFRDGVAETGPDGATRFAMRRGVVPCLLATMTTVIGLLSLASSEVTPIKTFGIVASIGVVTSLALLLCLMPGAMRWVAARLARSGTREPTRARRVDGALDRLHTAVRSAPIAISLLFTVAMSVLACGLLSVRTSVSIESLFPAGSQVLADNAWMQERIGPLVSFEVVLQFPEETPFEPLNELELVADVQKAIDDADGLGASISAATFFPTIPKAGGLRNTSARGMIRGRLKADMERLESTDYVVRVDGWRSWRVSARAWSDRSTDYGQVLDHLGQTVEPVLAKHTASGVRVFYTGSLPVAYEAQRVLLASFFRSFLAALALVAVVMMVVMRSVSGGLIAMLPNLFPTLTMFGIMGWLGAPVDIGAVMTASVALGIAVDDTLHFLFWWRGEVRRGASPGEAVRSSYASCGTAMAQTTLVCGLGLLAYGFSDFVPTQRFAWFMLGLLTCALVGDLLFLPSLLLGPAGRWLRPKVEHAVGSGDTEIEDQHAVAAATPATAS